MTERPVPVGRIARGGAVLAQEGRRDAQSMATVTRALAQKDAPQPTTFDMLNVVEGTSPAVVDSMYLVRLKGVTEDTPLGVLTAQPGIPPVGPATMGLALFEYSGAGGGQIESKLRLIEECSKWFTKTALDNGTLRVIPKVPYILKKDRAYFVGLVVSEALCTTCWFNTAAPSLALRTVFAVTIATGFPREIVIVENTTKLALTTDVFWSYVLRDEASFLLY